MKSWTEQFLYTEEQIANVRPNESLDGVVLVVAEVGTPKSETSRLYLTKQEAKDLAQLFINHTS